MVIYIHIPFCIKKCNYCDFLSAPCDKITQDKYVECLKREMMYYGDIYGKNARDESVTSVFFGGGTPSILDSEHIIELMKVLREQYDIEETAEITIECNPGTITLHKLKAYKEAGINRLSIGLQSADNEELKGIGRIHTYEEFLTGYRWAREAGFNNINIDLMSALPGQTIDSYKRTIEKILSLQPEHISAYSLILEPDTPLNTQIERLREHNQPTGLPDEDTEREMYYMTEQLLRVAGYERYEISNYAKNGYECKHNSAYWTRHNYIGMGLGASSCMDNVRKKNIADLSEYISIFGDGFEVNGYIKENGAVDISETEVLSREDMMSEFMFLGLRMMKGVSKSQFFKEFGVSFHEVYGMVTAKLMSQGLIEESDDGDTVRLTPQGIDVSNMVMAQYLV